MFNNNNAREYTALYSAFLWTQAKRSLNLVVSDMILVSAKLA